MVPGEPEVGRAGHDSQRQRAGHEDSGPPLASARPDPPAGTASRPTWRTARVGAWPGRMLAGPGTDALAGSAGDMIGGSRLGTRRSAEGCRLAHGGPGRLIPGARTAVTRLGQPRFGQLRSAQARSGQARGQDRAGRRVVLVRAGVRPALGRGVQVRPVAGGRVAVHDLPGLGGRHVSGRLADREGRVPRLGVPGLAIPGTGPRRSGLTVAAVIDAGIRVAVRRRPDVAHGPGIARARVIAVAARPRRPVPGGELAGRIERRRLAGCRRETADRALARGAARSIPSAAGQEATAVLGRPAVRGVAGREKPCVTARSVAVGRCGLFSGRARPPGRAVPPPRRSASGVVTRVTHAASVSRRRRVS